VDDSDLASLEELRDAAWVCNGQALTFVERYGKPPHFSKDAWTATMQARKYLRYLDRHVETLEDCRIRWNDAAYGVNGALDALGAIKKARAGQLVPIFVGQSSYATAHEAAPGMVEHVLQIFRSAAGEYDQEFVTDLADRLRDVQLRDLYGHIECEFWAAFDQLATREERPTLGEIAIDKPNMSVDAARLRLERIANCGEPYTSQRQLADDLGCSLATVNKAIAKSTKLRTWMASGRRTAPVAVRMDDIIADRVHQCRESAPDSYLPDDDVDTILQKLVAEAPTDRREETRQAIANLNADARRQIAQIISENPEYGQIMWPSL
jgi:hypothetical protein